MANVEIQERTTTVKDRSLAQEVGPLGLDVLLNPAINELTASTEEASRPYKLRELLPPAICSQEVRLSRVLANLCRQNSDVERYMSLQALLSLNEWLSDLELAIQQTMYDRHY